MYGDFPDFILSDRMQNDMMYPETERTLKRSWQTYEKETVGACTGSVYGGRT